jgi:hypothetical protein
LMAICGRPPRFFFFSMKRSYHARKVVDKYPGFMPKS